MVRCEDCRMIYTNPVRAPLATGSHYELAGGEYLSPEKVESDYADVRFSRELRIFRNFCPRGAVLDVGCSSGAFLYQLKQRFPTDYTILGTDISTAPLQHAAAMGVPVVKGDFLTQDFPQQFQAVTFWAVIEHLFEPSAFLNKASAILKPGGLCFILVPNMRSLAVRLLGAKYRYIYSEHLNYFSADTLFRFASRNLRVVTMTSMHFNPAVIWKDSRGEGQEVPRADRARLLKRTNAWKASRWLLPAQLAYRGAEKVLGRYRLADNLLVIARKT